MNIKSLLLGSAVASVAFTGAQAADAIFVPEPEPMEYVRVCDVYGAGFFYIPGTENCLKIGGYARYQIDAKQGDDGWKKFGRAQLTLDARSETELGTLRAFTEIWFNSHSGFRGVTNASVANLPTGFKLADNQDGIVLRNAFIELGGLFMGIKTTLWDGALDGEYDNFGYDSRVHTVGYNFAAANGVTVGLALEEYDFNYDYTPNVVGKVGVKQGWGSFNVFAGYDATFEKWAAKVTADLKLSDPLTLQLAAAYSSGVSQYATGFNYSRTNSVIVGHGGYEWGAGAHLKYAVNSKLALGFGGQYYGNSHAYNFTIPGTPPINVVSAGGNDDWAIGAVIDYKIVKGFDAKLAVNYRDGDSYSKNDNWDGFLRLTRSF